VSREIKFRAWVENEHIKNGPYPFMNHHIEFMGGLINDIFATSGKEPLNSLHNKITYMQYTGLKDAKGKEIYEGDILRFKARKGYEYIGNIGVVNWSYMAYIIGTEVGEYLFLYLDEFEIIGNIYEHSHLLEVQHD